MVFVCLLFL